MGTKKHSRFHMAEREREREGERERGREREREREGEGGGRREREGDWDKVMRQTKNMKGEEVEKGGIERKRLRWRRRRMRKKGRRCVSEWKSV